jgi:hypothetical protein
VDSADPLLWRYVRERLFIPRMALLYVLLAGCGMAASVHTAPALCIVAALALLYLSALRLWDDLADRAHDRARHPQRVLARQARNAAFIVAVAILMVLLGALLYWHAGAIRVEWLATAMLALALFYLAGVFWPALRPLRMAAVLLKYPAFVLVVADRPMEPAAQLLALLAWLPPLAAEMRSEGRTVLVYSLLLLAAAMPWLLK